MDWKLYMFEPQETFSLCKLIISGICGSDAELNGLWPMPTPPLAEAVLSLGQGTAMAANRDCFMIDPNTVLNLREWTAMLSCGPLVLQHRPNKVFFQVLFVDYFFLFLL
jgi:hypothetical protein